MYKKIIFISVLLCSSIGFYFSQLPTNHINIKLSEGVIYDENDSILSYTDLPYNDFTSVRFYHSDDHNDLAYYLLTCRFKRVNSYTFWADLDSEFDFCHPNKVKKLSISGQSNINLMNLSNLEYLQISFEDQIEYDYYTSQINELNELNELILTGNFEFNADDLNEVKIGRLSLEQTELASIPDLSDYKYLNEFRLNIKDADADLCLDLVNTMPSNIESIRIDVNSDNYFSITQETIDLILLGDIDIDYSFAYQDGYPYVSTRNESIPFEYYEVVDSCS